MAEWKEEDLDLAIAISLSQPDTPTQRIKIEPPDRDDDWLDELLAREAFQEQIDITAFDTSYDDLDDKQLYQQTQIPLPPTKPSVYEVAHEFHELHDPTPSIYQLFTDFDQLFFNSSLGSVSLEWSHKMTTCAGITYYNPMSHFCHIRLSRPILTLRPRKDLVETLLHEMIHALLFIAEDNRDHSDHGPQFQYHQHRINNLANCKISVFHSFHDEVRSLKKHWWRCEGRCRYREPFYGFVKRAVNRAPGKADTWWRSHQDTCGGKFAKIRSPEPKKTEKAKNRSPEKAKNSTKAAKISFKSEPNYDRQNRIGTIEHSFRTQPIASQGFAVKSTMEIDVTSPILIRDSDDESKPELSRLLTPPNSPPVPTSPFPIYSYATQFSSKIRTKSPTCTSPIYSYATQSTSKNKPRSPTSPIYSYATQSSSKIRTRSPTSPIYSYATQSSSKIRTKFSPYASTQPLSQSTSSKRIVLNLQECLFCNGFFRKECFEEHFDECVKCFPTD